MRRFLMALVAAGLAVAVAAPAMADQPTARDIQSAVDSYLADSNQDVNLVDERPYLIQGRADLMRAIQPA